MMFFKRTETKRFSSMTSFLVAIFIVFLVFPVSVSYLCLAFITIGDMGGKLIGLKYGRMKLIDARTFAGSLGFLRLFATAITRYQVFMAYGWCTLRHTYGAFFVQS